MSKLMKLCVMHCAIVMLLIGAVSVANKIIISPLRTQFQTAHAKVAELNKQLVDMNKKLENVKGEVIKDLNLDDIKLLSIYIKENTDNLTTSIINDTAKAIVEAAWENEVPLCIMVGIAQAISMFNTTHVDDFGNRGVLAVSNNYIIKSNKKSVYFNDVYNGAETGAEEISRLLSVHKNKNLNLIIKEYLFPGKIDTYEAMNIFEAATQFSKFKYEKYRTHLKNLEVSDSSEQE